MSIITMWGSLIDSSFVQGFIAGAAMIMLGSAVAVFVLVLKAKEMNDQ